MTKIVKSNNIPYTETNAVFHEGKRLDKIVNKLESFKVDGETIQYKETTQEYTLERGEKDGNGYYMYACKKSDYLYQSYKGGEIVSISFKDNDIIEEDYSLDIFKGRGEDYSRNIIFQVPMQLEWNPVTIDKYWFNIYDYPYPFLRSVKDLGSTITLRLKVRNYNQFPRGIIKGYINDLLYTRRVYLDQREFRQDIRAEFIHMVDSLPKNSPLRPFTMEFLEEGTVTLNVSKDTIRVVKNGENFSVYTTYLSGGRNINVKKGTKILFFNGRPIETTIREVETSLDYIVYGNIMSAAMYYDYNSVDPKLMRYASVSNVNSTQAFLPKTGMCDALDVVATTSSTSDVSYFTQATKLKYLPRDWRLDEPTNSGSGYKLPSLVSTPYLYNFMSMYWQGLFSESNTSIERIYLLSQDAVSNFASNLASIKCGGSNGYFIVSEDFEMPDLSSTRFANWKVIRVKPYNEGDDLTYYDFENLKKEYTMQCILEALKYATFTQDVSGILGDL